MMRFAWLAMGVVGAAAVAVAGAQNPGGDRFGPPPSRVAAALDADHDSIISAEEIQASAATLASLDANADGRLTPDELRPLGFPGGRGGRRGRQGAGPEGPGGGPAVSAADLTDTLMSFDRNGDGSLDRAEVPERFQGLFDRADADKNGVLTRAEIDQSAATSMSSEAGGRRGGREGGEFGRRGGRGGPGDPLVRALDADGDGTVSAAELTAAPSRLTALDVNGDGRLESEEIRPAFGRGRENGPAGRRGPGGA